MTARNFLIRGLLAGVLAGFVAFLVAHQVGEPHVDRAIAIEEAGSTTRRTRTPRSRPGTATRTKAPSSRATTRAPGGWRPAPSRSAPRSAAWSRSSRPD